MEFSLINGNTLEKRMIEEGVDFLAHYLYSGLTSAAIKEGFEAMLIAILVFMYLDKVQARDKRPIIKL